MMNKKPVMPVRARCVLVVSDLKPDLRAGDGVRCWWQIRHYQSCMGVSVRVIGIRLGLQIRKPHDKHVNANGDFFCGN